MLLLSKRSTYLLINDKICLQNNRKFARYQLSGDILFIFPLHEEKNTIDRILKFTCIIVQQKIEE